MTKRHFKQLLKDIEESEDAVPTFKWGTERMIMKVLTEEIFYDMLPKKIKDFYLRKAANRAYLLTSWFADKHYHVLTEMVLRQRMQFKPKKVPTIQDAIAEMKNSLTKWIKKT